MQDFNSFSIMFYYIISTEYHKIGDLFCLVHISGLSHSVIYRLQRGLRDLIQLHLSSSISFLTESCCLPVEQISVLLSFESRQLELFFYYIAK